MFSLTDLLAMFFKTMNNVLIAVESKEINGVLLSSLYLTRIDDTMCVATPITDGHYIITQTHHIFDNMKVELHNEGFRVFNSELIYFKNVNPEEWFNQSMQEMPKWYKAEYNEIAEKFHKMIDLKFKGSTIS